MAILYNAQKFRIHREAVKRAILKGSVFVYPTDTIYGIGCDATNSVAVERIRRLKQRFGQAFSIIAPSREWIFDHCEVPEGMKMWVDKLPGPYTLILPYSKDRSVASNVAPEEDTLGVRIPKHWISELATELEIPLVTTSVNKHGQPHMKSIATGDKEILNTVDFVVDEGEKSGKPSKIIKWNGHAVEIIER